MVRWAVSGQEPRVRGVRSALAAAALAGTLVAAGCGSLRAGAAVEVGDHTLTVGRFQSQVQDLVDKSGRTDVGPDELRSAQRSLLRQYVDNQLIRVVARRQGVTATPAEIGDVISQIRSQRVLVPDDMLRDFARFVVLERKLEERALGHAPTTPRQQRIAQRQVGDEFVRVADEVGVRVNPRYGTWGAGQVEEGGALVTPEPTSLSRGG